MPNFRHILKITFCLIILLTLSACSGEAKLDARALADKLLADIITQEMLPVVPERLNRFFADLDTSVLNETLYYHCAEAIIADELLIFQVKESRQMAALKSTLNAHYQERVELFAGYAPVEADRIRRRLVIEKDRWLIILISDNNTQGERLINDSFK